MSRADRISVVCMIAAILVAIFNSERALRQQRKLNAEATEASRVNAERTFALQEESMRMAYGSSRP